MSIVTFKPAIRKGSHVIITAYGESGCGKTLSLLRLGRGLVGPKGKLAMIDTETGRGMIYADAIPGGYDYAELTPPYEPERYIEALDAAEEAGYEAVIIDSGSHEWEGLGGILEIADASDARGLVKWTKPKARHKKYVQRLLRSRMHLLISLRAKEKMIQVGGTIPVPAGMKSGDIISGGFVPIQDKRFIFETTVQLFFPTGGERGVPMLTWPQFKCPKDLEGAFPPATQINEDTGRMIAEWVAGGVAVDHAYETLKKAAEDVADMGSEKLRLHWEKTLTKIERKQLAGELDNLKSIAASADAAKEQASLPPAEPPADDGTVPPPAAASQAGPQEDAFGLLPLSTDEEACANILKAVQACTLLAGVDEVKAHWESRMKRLPEPLWTKLMADIGKHETALQRGAAA